MQTQTRMRDVLEVRTTQKGEKQARTNLLVTLENVQPPPYERLANIARPILVRKSTCSVRILDVFVAATSLMRQIWASPYPRVP